MNNSTYNYAYILPAYFLYFMHNTNILIIGTVIATCSSQPRLDCRYFWHISTKRINSVMRVSINQ